MTCVLLPQGPSVHSTLASISRFTKPHLLLLATLRINVMAYKLGLARKVEQPSLGQLTAAGTKRLDFNLRDHFAVGYALPLAVPSKVGRHIGEYTQPQQDPVKADDAARKDGEEH